MDFAEFLRRLQSDHKIRKVADFYEKLGGKKKLDVEERTFRAILSGKLPPTLKFFIKIFNQLDGAILKEAVESFLNSAVPESENKRIKTFVRDSLPILDTEETKGLFESSKDKMTLTESQLKFLSANREAMRLFHRLTLDDVILYADLNSPDKINAAKLLEAHGLAKRRADGALLAPAEAVMLPNRDAGRQPYKFANRYILQHIDAYLTDDKDNERICYSMQYVPRTVYKTLLDETEAHKKRVQKLAATIDDLKKDPNKDFHVPILLVSYMKRIQNDEL